MYTYIYFLFFFFCYHTAFIRNITTMWFLEKFKKMIKKTTGFLQTRLVRPRGNAFPAYARPSLSPVPRAVGGALKVTTINKFTGFVCVCVWGGGRGTKDDN